MGVFYDELARYQKEQEPVNSVKSWTETGRGKLPTADSRLIVHDTPRFDADPRSLDGIGEKTKRLPGYVGDLDEQDSPAGQGIDASEFQK